MSELVTRWPNNPVLSAADIPGRANCVFNSGATLHDGQIVMMANTWSADWTPRFLVARSADGYRFEVEDRDTVGPLGEYPYGKHDGIFDTRITTMEGWHYVTFNVSSHLGGRILLTRTRDFGEFERLGLITGPDHRNCVLFPEKIGGYYVRLERPNVGESGDMYVSYSPDLVYWGRTELVLARGTRYWESAKLGPGAPPVKTDEGWLIIYHGCRESMNDTAYHAGVLLLDLNDPSRVIGKLRACLMWPQETYERVGNVGNVVFPTAALVHGGPDELKIYYGAADTCVCLATARVSELVAACLRDGPLDAEHK